MKRPHPRARISLRAKTTQNHSGTSYSPRWPDGPQEGIENLHDLLTLRRREFFHLIEPPPEAGVMEACNLFYLL